MDKLNTLSTTVNLNKDNPVLKTKPVSLKKKVSNILLETTSKSKLILILKSKSMSMLISAHQALTPLPSKEVNPVPKMKSLIQKKKAGAPLQVSQLVPPPPLTMADLSKENLVPRTKPLSLKNKPPLPLLASQLVPPPPLTMANLNKHNQSLKTKKLNLSLSSLIMILKSKLTSMSKFKLMSTLISPMLQNDKLQPPHLVPTLKARMETRMLAAALDHHQTKMSKLLSIRTETKTDLLPNNNNNKGNTGSSPAQDVEVNIDQNGSEDKEESSAQPTSTKTNTRRPSSPASNDQDVDVTITQVAAEEEVTQQVSQPAAQQVVVVVEAEQEEEEEDSDDEVEEAEEEVQQATKPAAQTVTTSAPECDTTTPDQSVNIGSSGLKATNDAKPVQSADNDEATDNSGASRFGVPMSIMTVVATLYVLA